MVGSLEVRRLPSPSTLPWRAASSRITQHNLVFQSQQDQIDSIQRKLAPLSSALDEVATIEEELQEANIEENDYTVFTHADLDFELKLAQQTVVKKIKFIDNQVSTRSSFFSIPPEHFD